MAKMTPKQIELTDRILATNGFSTELYKLESKPLEALLVRNFSRTPTYDIIVPVNYEYGSSEFLSETKKLKGAIVGQAEFTRTRIMVRVYNDQELFSDSLQDTQEVIPIYKVKT